MAVLPTVEQFPTFANICSRLALSAFQCIWYLPDKQRSCTVQIPANESHLVLELATKLIQGKSFNTEELAEIAERSCCARHHRNKIWGSKLANSLALQWQTELKNYMSVTTPNSGHMVKVEDASFPSCGTYHLPGRVAFSKHVVFEGDTLASTLLSSIKSLASMMVSVYCFTYVDDAFQGMIKIGYTSRPIDHRLKEWVECGHGHPQLLKSYSNVRHPERVEILTHFQLVKQWYAMRWCDYHKKAHIEWFKVNVSTASRVVQSWSSWVERSNPYNRRGCLKAFWRDIINFLSAYEIRITGELMVQIQEVEEGSIDVAPLIDDDMLRKKVVELERVDVKWRCQDTEQSVL